MDSVEKVRLAGVVNTMKKQPGRLIVRARDNRPKEFKVGRLHEDTCFILSTHLD